MPPPTASAESVSASSLRMTQIELSDTAKARVTGMVELRQIVNELIQQQLEDYPDEDIKAT